MIKQCCDNNNNNKMSLNKSVYLKKLEMCDKEMCINYNECK